MYLILIFVSLYFIAFFTVAGHSLIKVWAHGALFVVFLDLFLLEFFAASIVAMMFHFSISCNCLGAMFIVLLFEVYRNLKNLV